MRELQRARAQGVAQRSLMTQTLHDREADMLERHAGKFGVEIVRGLTKRLRIDLFTNVNRFARDLSAVSDNDDEHFGRAQRNELHFFQNAVASGERQRKRDEA